MSSQQQPVPQSGIELHSSWFAINSAQMEKLPPTIPKVNMRPRMRAVLLVMTWNNRSSGLSSSPNPAKGNSVQFCDAPYPIIANPLGCLHQNPLSLNRCNGKACHMISGTSNVSTPDLSPLPSSLSAPHTGVNWKTERLWALGHFNLGNCVAPCLSRLPARLPEITGRPRWLRPGWGGATRGGRSK